MESSQQDVVVGEGVLMRHQAMPGLSNDEVLHSGSLESRNGPLRCVRLRTEPRLLTATTAPCTLRRSLRIGTSSAEAKPPWCPHVILAMSSRFLKTILVGPAISSLSPSHHLVSAVQTQRTDPHHPRRLSAIAPPKPARSLARISQTRSRFHVFLDVEPTSLRTLSMS